MRRRPRSRPSAPRYWQSLASQYGSTSSPLPAGGEKLGTSIGDPLVSTAQQPLTQRAQTYQQQAQQSVLQAIALWKKAIVLQPDNSTYERAIARDALSVQDYKTAYQAVQRVLVLEPTAPDKKQLTTLLKQLKPLIGITTVSRQHRLPLAFLAWQTPCKGCGKPYRPHVAGVAR